MGISLSRFTATIKIESLIHDWFSYEYGWILVQKVEEGKLTDKMAWNTRMQGKKIEWVDITSELKF